MDRQFWCQTIHTWFVPIGLLYGAASASDRAERPAGRIGAQFGRFRIGMLLDFPGREVWDFFVPDVLQDQRFFPVANDHPIALTDLQLLHAVLLPPRRDHPTAWPRFSCSR